MQRKRLGVIGLGFLTLFIRSQCLAQGPSISPNGIVPLFSSSTNIQPGEWVSIYGNNLASGTTVWNGNFPTSLGGTSVKINGKAGYLYFVSPGQINLQAPDDTATGTVLVEVTTASGSASSTVTLGQFGPSFSLLDSKHVAGIILRSSGSGAYGGGTYDIIGPTGSSLGYRTVAALPGDTIELFGVGFGPTSPTVPAGQTFSGAASTTNTVNLLINNLRVTPAFVGLSSAGLFQFNLTVPPGLGTGDVSLSATVGGVQTPSGIVISLQNPAITPRVQSLTLSTSSVAGGGSVTGTVALSTVAPSGGAVVVLSSSSSTASVPATVTVPAGAASATFTVSIGSVSSGQTATITASYGGSSVQATLTITASITPLINLTGTFSGTATASNDGMFGGPPQVSGPMSLVLTQTESTAICTVWERPAPCIFGYGNTFYEYNHPVIPVLVRGTVNGSTVTLTLTDNTGSCPVLFTHSLTTATNSSITGTYVKRGDCSDTTVTGSFAVTRQ